MRSITQTGGSSHNYNMNGSNTGTCENYPPRTPSIALIQRHLDPQQPQRAHPPKPHTIRDHHNPSTQKRTAGDGQKWQYGRTVNNLQRVYAVMNGALAAKKIVRNSDNPANGSASYAGELSCLLRPPLPFRLMQRRVEGGS